ncbi:MAG: hypothetical protein ACKO2A_01730, partial [Acidimicrobiaceae bacterium]
MHKVFSNDDAQHERDDRQEHHQNHERPRDKRAGAVDSDQMVLVPSTSGRIDTSVISRTRRRPFGDRS